MTIQPEAIERIVDVLKSEDSYRKLSRESLRDRGFTFDAVLASKDSMSIVVVEIKDKLDDKSIRDCVRQLRSLVWTLFADGKRIIVSAVVVLDEDMPGTAAAMLAKHLSGTCRVFVVSKGMTPEELRAELLSLAKPEFARMSPNEGSADRLVQVISSIKGKAKKEFAAQLIALVKGAKSADEVTNRLFEQYKQRVREVDDAAPKPKS